MAVGLGKVGVFHDTQAGRLGVPAAEQPTQVVAGLQGRRTAVGEPAGRDQRGVGEFPPAVQTPARFLPPARCGCGRQPVEPGTQAVPLVIKDAGGHARQLCRREQDAAAGTVGVRGRPVDEGGDAFEQRCRYPQGLGQGVVPPGQFIEASLRGAHRRFKAGHQAVRNGQRIGGGQVRKLGQQAAGDGAAGIVTQS